MKVFTDCRIPIKMWADKIDELALQQARNLASLPFAYSHIALMPDVHCGLGMPIGGVLATKGIVVPNAVGVDIGCGMCAIKTSLRVEDVDRKRIVKVLELIRQVIPLGFDHHKALQDESLLPEGHDIDKLPCVKNLIAAARYQIGTLGGGNHFIEIDEDADGGKYLVIHSGSRNLGTQVAEFYQQLAVDLNVGKEEYFHQREEIIRTYKEQGRRTEIQATIKALEKEFNAKEPTLPRDLCFLYDSFMEDYLHDVDICQKFAERNRAKMAEIILERCGWTAVETFQTIHNYIDVNEMILRKGSVSAKAGEKLLIPINMRDGSLICIGKGNPDWNFSAPHGAGRLLSRTEAKKRLSMEEYKKEMAGIYTTSVNEDTLDEAPMAYKSLSDIIDGIGESVEVIEVLKPIYNFKAN